MCVVVQPPETPSEVAEKVGGPVGIKNEEVYVVVSLLRKTTSRLLSEEVDTKGRVTKQVEDTVLVEVHECRVEVGQAPVSVLSETQNVSPLRVRLRELYVGILVSSLFTRDLL